METLGNGNLNVECRHISHPQLPAQLTSISHLHHSNIWPPTPKREPSCSWSRPAAVCPVSWAWPPLVWPFLFVCWSRSNLPPIFLTPLLLGLILFTLQPLSYWPNSLRWSALPEQIHPHPETPPPTPSLVCVSSLSIMAGWLPAKRLRKPVVPISSSPLTRVMWHFCVETLWSAWHFIVAPFVCRCLQRKAQASVLCLHWRFCTNPLPFPAARV